MLQSTGGGRGCIQILCYSVGHVTSRTVPSSVEALGLFVGGSGGGWIR